MDKIYYHYCSIETFYSIMETSTLRFGNPLCMNDAAELIWLISQLRKVIEKNTKYKDITNNWYIVEKNAKEILESINNIIPFIACLSKDGDVLSQWRAYADDGRGVAIGIDINKLPKMISGEDVIYEEQQQFDILTKKIEQNILEELNQTIIKNDENEINRKIVKLISRIIKEALKCKNPAFSEEREYRLFYAGNQNSDINFRVAGGKIVPYKEYNFGNNKNLIKQIVIGPKSLVNDVNLAWFLDKLGYQWHSKNQSNSVNPLSIKNDSRWNEFVKISKSTYR